MIAVSFALIAAAVGAALGARALLDPAWTTRLVRLAPVADPPEGRAELRAIYGGLFTAGHVFAAAAVLASPAGAWAAAAVGAGWLGAGVVRFAFLRADGAPTRYNALGALFELAMGAALCAPLAFAV